MSGSGSTAGKLRGVVAALTVVFAAPSLFAQPLPPAGGVPPLELPARPQPRPGSVPPAVPLQPPPIALPPAPVPARPVPGLPVPQATVPPLPVPSAPAGNPLPVPSLLPGATPPAVVPDVAPVVVPEIPPIGAADLFAPNSWDRGSQGIQGVRPLPGSAADEFGKELAAREGFRTYTWDDAYVSALPSTLLWESPLAVNRDPRMKTLFSNQSNFRGSSSLETSIGGTVGLVRYTTAGRDLKFQVDIFGVTHTRLSPEDVTVADYRFGLPFTFQWNWWHGKVGYEHTSSHLGDRLIRATGREVNSHAKDEIVAGLGRWVSDNWRAYAEIGYAFFDLNPDRKKGPFRGDVGFEWYMRQPTGFWGTPFAAGNIEWRQDQDYAANYNVQAGWLWRNPYQRFGSFRVYAQYYSGGSPYGQFYNQKESFSAVGIAFDY